MATSTSSKRPVVLSLRELERYPTVYDRYEMTLPFYNKALNPFDNPLECSGQLGGYCWNARCVGCDTSISFAKVKAMAVQQTEKRWSWFSEARKLDDRLGRRLGTLGFLPLEIREKIWHAAIEDCMDTTFYGRYQHGSRELEFIKGWNQGPLNMTQSSSSRPTISVGPHSEVSPDNVFNFHTNILFQRPWYSNGVMQLRHASPEAKIELENVFVFTNTFRFSCPVFWHFLNSLSARQITLLRSMTIEVFNCYGCHDYIPRQLRSCCEAWITLIKRLPATLQSVTFELNWIVVGFLTGKRSWGIQDINKILAQLEIMIKKIRRQAPNATISTGPWGEDCEILQDMVDELDEYSEDYKKWWRESREKTMSQGEKT